MPGEDALAAAYGLRLASRRLHQALAYWHGKRGNRLMPSRADLDPVEIPQLLPYVILIDVSGPPPDFRYRLLGTKVVSISAGDYTGMRLADLPGKGPGSVVWDNCLETVRRRAPFSRLPPYVGPDPDVRPGENLLMPLSRDGESVDMIFQVIDFTRPAGQTARPWS